MTPLSSEQLSSPYTLSGVCKDVRIVEWRPTPEYLSSTSYSVQALTVLDKTCQQAVSKFKSFLKSESLTGKAPTTIAFSVSLMPADASRHGTEYRNLNDITFRFFNRTKEYDEDGNVYLIWAYSQRSNHYIYIRNDVLNDDGKTVNSEFVKIFAHEIGHTLSYYYGIYDNHSGDKDAEDEKLARKFTTYLHYGE